MTRRSTGTGSVYERSDGKWVAQVDNGWLASGRRRYLRRVRPNRKQALIALGELERIKARELEAVDASQTLKQYLDRWVANLEASGTRAPNTVAAYRSDCVHVCDVIGHVRLLDLRPRHVQDLMAALPSKEGRGRGGGKLSPRTQLNIRTTLHTAIEQAVKHRTLDWNPVSVVDRPRVERGDVVPLTNVQAREVLRRLADHRLGAMYTVACAVGLRMSEARGLTWRHVDLDEGVLQVRVQLQRVKNEAGERHYALADLKSRKSRRDIPLPQVAVDALREHRRRQAAERLANADRWVDGCCATCGWVDAGLLFTTCSDVRSAGRPLDARAARRPWQDATEDVTGRRHRFHDARHFAASMLIAQGVPLAVVQDMLGHASIMVTRDIYGHLDAGHLRQASDAAQRALG